MTVEGTGYTTPHELEWQPGSALNLNVPYSQTDGQTEYTFSSWSDGGPQRRTVRPASDITYTAVFTQETASNTPPIALVFDRDDSLVPDSVEAGESIDLEFSMNRASGPFGSGGISVSFPELTAENTNNIATGYESSQGSVSTTSYTNGTSKVLYFDNSTNNVGVYKSGATSRTRPEHLLVESGDTSWPVNVDRVLRLRVIPKQEGQFRIRFRYWLCDNEDLNCDRAPSSTSNSDGQDQQGYYVNEYTVEVTAPPEASGGPPTITESYAIIDGRRVEHKRIVVTPGESVFFSATPSNEDRLLDLVEWYTGDNIIDSSRYHPSGIAKTSILRFSDNDGAGSTGEVKVVFHDVSGQSVSETWMVTVAGTDYEESCPRTTFTPYAGKGVTVSEIKANQLSVRAGDSVNVSFARQTQTFDDARFYEKLSLVGADGTEIASTGSFASLPGLNPLGLQILSQEYGATNYAIGVPEGTKTGLYTLTAQILSENLSEECDFKEAEAKVAVRAGLAFGEEVAVRGIPEVIPPSPGQPLSILEFTLEINAGPERTVFENAARIAEDLGIAFDESFSGEGQVTIAFPKDTWVDHENIKILISTEYGEWPTRKWVDYGPTEELHSRYRDEQLMRIEERIKQMADLLAKLTDKVITATLRQAGNLIGTIPIAGDFANAAIDLGLDLWETGGLLLEAAELGSELGNDIVEGVTELNEVAPIEPGPLDPWLGKSCRNFTNEITVPWYTGLQSWLGRKDGTFTPFETVKAIRVQVPADLSVEDYVSLTADYQTSQLEFPLNPLEITYKFLSLNSKGRSVQRTIENLGLASAPENSFFNIHTREGTLELSNIVPDNTLFPSCGRSDFTTAGLAPVPVGLGIIVSPSVLTVQEGGSATYTVRLSAEPSGKVSVENGSGFGTDISVTPRFISFDADDWDRPRAVTVRARQDNDADRDDPVELVHTAYDSDRTELDRKNVVVIIEEDDAPQVGPSGPRWLSASTELTPRSGYGGRGTARVLTQDTSQAPRISIEGPELEDPELSDTNEPRSCVLETSPAGYILGVTKCWQTFFNVPVNDSSSPRTYTVTASSGDIDGDIAVQVSVAPTPTLVTAPDQQTASVVEAVGTAFAPLGSNLQWALHFDNAAQEWLGYNPKTPSVGTLNQLVPGQVYWIGLEEDQTVDLGGGSRSLKAGLNQIVW